MNPISLEQGPHHRDPLLEEECAMNLFRKGPDGKVNFQRNDLLTRMV